MKLSIVIVNYNVSYFLEQTLKSVYAATKNIDTEIFVVDNASADGSVEMLKQKFPFVILIENKTNVGFSKANNQAIKIAKGQYILLLNPDTLVQEDTFDKTIAYLDQHLDVGGLGVYMVDGKGRFLPESKRALPTPLVALYKIIGLSWLFPTSKRFGKYHLGYLDKDKTHEVEVLSGAFMMLRKEALDKVGLLDEDYFMYGEDIDLSYRILKAGYKNVYFADTKIIHYKGESTKKSSINYVLVFYGAMIIFAKKHFKGLYQGLFVSLIQFAIYARAFISILVRTINKTGLTILRILVIYLGFYGIAYFWSVNIKHSEDFYPDFYYFTIIPSYILIWIVVVFYNGGFDKPTKIYRIVRGVVLGTILISSISNFVDSYRFSKALIILGSIWTLFSLLIIHYISKFIKTKAFDFSEDFQKKLIIVGESAEVNRVLELVRRSDIKFKYLGYVSEHIPNPMNDNFLGKIENLQQIATLYKPNEIIYCAKDIPAAHIIALMAKLESSEIEFKIVPDDSNFVIGSGDKNQNGELYAVDVNINISTKNNIRNKRMLDIIFSLFFLLLFPFFLKNKYFNLKNSLSVLRGKKTWVGFAPGGSIEYAKIKSGVIDTLTQYQNFDIDTKTIDRLNLLYAKDYKTSMDINIIFNNLFRK